MKVTKLGSATVIVETSDIQILCDPWLTDGIYYGSWCNYPPINLNDCDFKNIDYIYISHIHPDHFDVKTMSLLSTKIPVLIHKYHQKFLKVNIERLGFQVIELDNAIPFTLKGTTKISIYAADNCDPRICGHLFGCLTADIKGSMQIDSLCIIEDDEHVLVNTNDCPYRIAKKTLVEVKKAYPKIDFALVGYTSASLYPHCMMDLSASEKFIGIEKAKQSGLSNALQTLAILRPKGYMLFAGTYIIGGEEYKKNEFLPLPEIQDAVTFIQTRLKAVDIKSRAVLLNFNEFYNLSSQLQSAPYEPINKDLRSKYIYDVARYFKYDFDVDDNPTEDILYEQFEKSLNRLRSKQTELGFFEDVNLVFDLPTGRFALINLKSCCLSIIDSFRDLDNWHRFQLNPKLLARVLRGPRYANWNNIEIGGLLNFSRKPDVYRMDIHVLINSLHE